MIDRFKSRPMLAALAAAAVTALGVGGVAVAQSGSSTPSGQGQAQGQPEQQGAPENSAADANEKADPNEKADGNEKPDANEKAGSEKADDDGPGGHADEPGNPNAANQAQGQQ